MIAEALNVEIVELLFVSDLEYGIDIYNDKIIDETKEFAYFSNSLLVDNVTYAIRIVIKKKMLAVDVNIFLFLQRMIKRNRKTSIFSWFAFDHNVSALSLDNAFGKRKPYTDTVSIYI